MIWICALLFHAHASREPTDYRQLLSSRACAQISTLSRQGKLTEALSIGESFEKELFLSSVVHYEMALALNQAARLSDALQYYDTVLQQDPDMVEALYDRGEIYLTQGNLELAEKDFLRAVQLRQNHWVLYFRLAELSGMQGDAELLEKRLILALKHGFSLQNLLQSGEH